MESPELGTTVVVEALKLLSLERGIRDFWPLVFMPCLQVAL